MSTDLRTIGLQNLEDAIHVLNESSRGMSLAYDLDTVRFLALARYWNFSYKYSLISYLDQQPVAIILNCTDEEAREAYTFYWGSLPAFRHGRTALLLFEASCRRLRDDGYLRLFGDAVPDRPLRRYRFLHAEELKVLLDMEAAAFALPPSGEHYEIRRLSAETLARVELPSAEPVHWCQRHSFLSRTSPAHEFLGAFADDRLQAYAVLGSNAGGTTLCDLRSPGACLSAGRELLRSLRARNYPLPFVATNVFEDSYSHRLLAEASFLVRKRSTALVRHLRRAL